MKRLVKRIFIYIIKKLNYSENILQDLLSNEELVSRKTIWKGYLYDKGWYKSFVEQKPIDKDGKPIPWLTYPFIDFLVPKMKEDKKIFEFGSGNSTLFYSQHFQEVNAVERNKEWHNYLKDVIPTNANLILSDSDEEYTKSLIGKYDLIIIDGYNRYECGLSSLDHLTGDGVVVVDDSEREEESRLCNMLAGEGFKRLDFWGTAAGIWYTKCTSLFYRKDNWLNL